MKSLGHTLAIALSYWLVGKLSLLLALPPGYASPIWPAAGIALAATLRLGPRALPGVALGALLANLRMHQIGDLDGWLAPAAVACGATLQAWSGSWLIRRFLGSPLLPVNPAALLRFMLLGGPLACVISPTIGLLSLVQLGHVSAAQLPFSWLAWWVGDAVGAMLLAPPLLVSARHVQNRLQLAPIATLTPSLLAALTAFAFFFWVRDMEDHRIQREFEAEARAIHQAMQEELRHAEADLNALQGLLASGASVGDADFQRAAALLRREPSAVATLAWIPRSGAAALTAPAAPGIIELLSTALHPGQLGHAALHPKGLHDNHVLLLRPVGTSTQDPGTLVSAINIHRLAGIALGRAAASGIELMIQERVGGSAPLRLFGQPLGPHAGRLELPLDLPDHSWQLSYYASQAYVDQRQNWNAWMALVCGMLFTSLFSIYLIVSSVRTAVAQHTLEARSRELEQAEREARRRNQGELFSGLAQELKAPLAAIAAASAQLALNDPGREAAQQQAIDVAARKLSATSGDIADLARLEAGRLELQLGTVDVVALLESAAQGAQEQAERANIRLELQPPVLPLELHGDLARLSQAIALLVAEACHHSSSALVRVTAAPRKLEGRAGICITIADTHDDSGPSPDPELLQQLAPQERPAASGIGLALARELVALHHGEIWRERELGAGSRYLVWLPVAHGAGVG